MRGLRLALACLAGALLAAGCRSADRPAPPRAGAADTQAVGARADSMRPADVAGPAGAQMPPGTLREVLERHTPAILAIPGVTGTGEGLEKNVAVVVVFVERRTPELEARLPRTIEGHPVVIRETGDVQAYPR